MGMDYIDHRNANRHYCQECDNELHPETEEWSIAHIQQEKVTCEDCRIETINKEMAELSNAN